MRQPVVSWVERVECECLARDPGKEKVIQGLACIPSSAVVHRYPHLIAMESLFSVLLFDCGRFSMTVPISKQSTEMNFYSSLTLGNFYSLEFHSLPVKF